LVGKFGEAQGIKIKDSGYPDFSPHAKATIVSDNLSNDGNRKYDARIANEIMGYKSTPGIMLKMEKLWNF